MLHFSRSAATTLLLLLSLIAPYPAYAVVPELSALPTRRSILSICEEISNAITSASEVYWPLELYYTEDNYHWASSSSQIATCSVEPGTPEDVGTVLQILAATNTSFGIKGGGHIANPGFSSTTGVQIAMSRFDGVTYNSDSQTVDIGAGLIWDDVYQALEPYGVNVVGGRVTGVGVGGFILGGGYSFLSNQHGLTVDTVVSYELVLPNGTVTSVTNASNPDLFWALKGGFNNFGIVTQFTLEAFTQGEVWGGTIISLGETDQAKTATANFYANVTDPKAALLTTFNWDLGLLKAVPCISMLQTIVEINLFYDGPSPPDGIFDEFLAIPYVEQDVSTRSFLSLVLTAPSNDTSTLRGYFDTVSTYELTPGLLDAVVNETEFWSDQLALEVPGLFISYDIEPFLSSVFSHGSDSAWPPSRAQGLLPMNIYYAWLDEASDGLIHQVMEESASYLTQVAVDEGQDVADAALYPNYAIYDTPTSRMYGDNIAALQIIKKQYDPNNVMGLAGGWKF
ncbi:FAD-binding domain-containing protein [Laetiporus sulphureus 93-53]|uniref:FAD-binding domain-containing protein n=1 Tax=Laetiporus sulphureus 93-53 TaxID=1314785 RepID=A0A165DJ58_9APHY|nr:FAD-binding domain-containing protein [Laetiporus sulphureus 93-53]KZT04998.1 FAD-binding domain-containing protein [Laetiporus sulphureus 93-53]